jgi:protein gp37
MAENTHISWATDTFNPWIGCAQISPACRFCYAKALDKRWGHQSWGRAVGTRRVTGDANWRKPLKWNREAADTGRTRRVFCASMADVFEDHPDLGAPRVRLWELIEQTPNLNWLLLTKRPENAAAMVPAGWASGWPKRVWLGVSAETQKFADQRIPILIDLPVTGERFVSAAPLLGPLDLDQPQCDDHGRREVVTDADGQEWCEYCAADGFTGELSFGHWLDPLNGGISWVITEGESGPKARPSHPDWFRSLRDQCLAAGVAFHHKQNGEWLCGRPPADWPLGDVWKHPKRHCWVDPITGKTKPFGEFTGVDDMAWAHVQKVGLRHAGRLLDGVLWDQVPDEMAVAR